MDQDLVVRVQQGDQHAFETLATADYPRLFRVAHGVLGDRALAEDATQQALLDIWRKMRRPRDPAKYSGWSYRLLVRVCYAEAKRQPTWMMSDDLPPASGDQVDACGARGRCTQRRRYCGATGGPAMNDEQKQPFLEAWFSDGEIAPENVKEGVAQVMSEVPQTGQQGR